MPAETSLPDSLEQHRQRLENSLNQLQKALRDWQTWTTEYEVFREELQQLPANAGREAMVS
jgi:unconventional prefoldin RPB5 interactor 1